jgi:hypothetical protein
VDARVTLARVLLLVSVSAFAIVGAGYLAAPGAMLSIVGIPSDPTSDFLMRTEGVALLSGAVFIWAARDASSTAARVVLGGLAFYFIVGSVVDLGAWLQHIVGPAALPSAVVRIAIGALCLITVSLLRRSNASGDHGIGA